jgi:hypothetical protein
MVAFGIIGWQMALLEIDSSMNNCAAIMYLYFLWLTFSRTTNCSRQIYQHPLPLASILNLLFGKILVEHESHAFF